MRIRIISIILVTALFQLLTPSVSFSREKKQDEELKKQLYDFLYEDNYNKALPILLKLDSLDPNNLEYKFLLGKSYYYSNAQKIKGIPYLEEFIEQSNKNKINPNTFFYLGKLYQVHYQFDEAIEAYNQYKAHSRKGDLDKEEVERLIKSCEYSKVKTKNPIKYTIRSIGDVINSPYPDYVPVISADESVLIFTSRRPGSIGGLQRSTGEQDSIYGSYFEDIYMALKLSDGSWSEPINIGYPINTKGHDACIALSPDGQKLFIYKSDGFRYGDIYESSLNGSEWSEPVKLPAPINSDNWEGSMSMTPDGQTIFFASNRPGGFGGKDIYMVKKLPNGQWAQAKNLGPDINTAEDDDAPFIHPDGVTLYFSSQGHETMGGYDIFKTSYLGNYKWMQPVNLGYPINTPDNDIYFVLSANGRRGYYSYVNDENFTAEDINVIEMPRDEWLAPEPVTVLKGVISSDIIDRIPPNTKIEVYDNETGEKMGVYRPNSETGKYMLILPRGHNYNINMSADNHLFHSENIIVPESQGEYMEINKDINLFEKKEGSKIVLRNIFFDFSTISLNNTSKIELKKIIDLLENDPGLSLEISGHTDSKGSFEINEKISKQRAQVVVDYLLSHGVDENRLFVQGYAYLQPVALNVFADGSDNELGRFENRRTEMKIIGVNIKDSEKSKKYKSEKIQEPVLEILNLDKIKNYMGGKIYKIEVAQTNADIPNDFFLGMEYITVEEINGIKSYTVGLYKEIEQAEQAVKELRKLGVKSPKIISYQDGKRL